MRRLGALGDGNQDQSKILPCLYTYLLDFMPQPRPKQFDSYRYIIPRRVGCRVPLFGVRVEEGKECTNIRESNISSFTLFMMRKWCFFAQRGQPSSGRRNTNTSKGKMYISEDDIEFISSWYDSFNSILLLSRRVQHELPSLSSFSIVKRESSALRHRQNKLSWV